MVLIDSLYINNSGGKVLLDVLVAELESSHLDVFYLFDERCQRDYAYVPDSRKMYLKASVLKRLVFYNKNKHRFSRVFCFANTPPPLKIKNAKVITYFHNTLLVDLPKSYTLKKKIKVNALFQLMNVFKKNSNSWMVQSNFVKSKLIDKLKISNDAVKVMPFYKLENMSIPTVKTKNSFCYVSTGAEHKNHNRLLDAWLLLLDSGLKPELHLTIPDQYGQLTMKIDEINKKGGNIINHGLISKADVSALYSKVEFLVYPSLTESFGLPLIEAVNAGCKVIASDLDYAKEIVSTQIHFDPYSSEDIAEKIRFCCNNSIAHSHIKVKNSITDIINLLQ